MRRAEAASGSPRGEAALSETCLLNVAGRGGRYSGLPTFLRECSTELLCIATKPLVRTGLKGDGTVWCEDNSSNIVQDETTTWKSHCDDFSWLRGRHG